MYDQARRDLLWREYYRAMQNGDKVNAQRILSQLHSPPSGLRASSARSGGCSRCKRSF